MAKNRKIIEVCHQFVCVRLRGKQLELPRKYMLNKLPPIHAQSYANENQFGIMRRPLPSVHINNKATFSNCQRRLEGQELLDAKDEGGTERQWPLN